LGSDESINPLVPKLQTVTTLWMQGDKRNIPCITLKPKELAEYYQLDKPCKIILEGHPELGGILIKHLCYLEDKREEQE
jgi:hypothetical protein